ncbi:endoribonuclease YBEY, chloroplastic-like isoform X3 [Olea europaea var. sylvestris]|uniref:endoribonuclease YBEY, chloroplastic-like isoform X3 n=1 Tax=Olea europaea var. sylvestris TaxID=158386 RepID=UPI000C1D292B|nr:endoribonuclease YBEY, chloroplastic-like isoform X3 [Olea europaea var. sylvestris]
MLPVLCNLCFLLANRPLIVLTDLLPIFGYEVNQFGEKSNSYLSLGSFSFSFSTTSSNSTCKTRDTSISDVGCFESVELSVLLCNAGLIRKLNREWRDEDNVIDILSMSQHIRELKLPITALRRVEEKGHTILDGIEILVQVKV